MTPELTPMSPGARAKTAGSDVLKIRQYTRKHIVTFLQQRPSKSFFNLSIVHPL
jgi:hypothetical protein